MECREVGGYLPAYADRDPVPSDVETHVEGCERCRSELTEFRELSAGLALLEDHPVEPPAWLLGTIIETVGEKATRLAAIRERTQKLADPKVLAGGAILAAGVAGALLYRGRRRRRRGLRDLLAEA